MVPFPDRLDVGDVSLRRMQAGDLPAIARQLGTPEIARWMAAARQPFGLAEAGEILALSQEPAQRIRVLERGGEVIGCLRLAPEMWFWLDAVAQGDGIMSTVLRAAISAHFAEPSPPLIACCRDDNVASQGVLVGLGFSRAPARRRMFFEAEGRSQPCHDYAMTPEQWQFLCPPVVSLEGLTARPALQKDAPRLALMRVGLVDARDAPWPEPQDLGAFIETHRSRAPGRGLFVLEDDHRRVIGAALIGEGEGVRSLHFLSEGDAGRHRGEAEELLGILGPQG
ncbi:Protein N-acetyltransferase, RimJ/RimL family [Salipiger thiooxidans]|uniref:Protein N-acetyltransferase, RimJ/RimL family n=1 Tax=Salipiger thiooxidans TaxID=282683 RepID=A0A1G7ARM0_9RHOB|nr:GNAT family N-acetyltransferase [Salipiger thiooxidans]SDE17372.1 Protein N-acetyltransferase, RimJ/RimL family [Salipiger thiooxidans]